ncbi:restriction endonuclease subunit S [Klebsiella pneumoniae]|uniref:restriction endonuclease subunit S n=1 Tax=Klebsiella pneumoniae TaxID=573 RepID=UPI00272F7408|nr:restriction endonuclease subunit S [Klebsiella pneumoniae]MDP0615492.1 restriction endonuclease subunit S [Klebsiella pneumoniae]
MVPKGWQKYSVGELCTSIVPGRNKPKVFDGDIPWVTTPEINGRYIPSKLQVNYVSTTALSDAGGKIVPQGAVVMAAVGELGLIAITSEPVVLNQQLHAFVCSKLVNNEYLAYWLTTQKPYMESIASKTTIPYMNKTNCESIPVLLPPLAEQFKIAQILSTWDKAISVTEKLLANSQQQKKALMQQLLTGKKRLLDENGVRFSGEWKQDVNLGSIINISKGVQINKNTLSEDGQFPVINGGIAPSGFTSEFNTDENTITISEGGNSCGYVAFQKKSFWCGGHCYAVRKTALDLSFTFHLLKYNELKIMGLRVGSGLPNIQKKAIEAFTVNFPVTSVEQQKIAAVLSAADDEIATLEKKLACLKDEKKALMQQLLTGKRRVKIDEAVAA